MLAGNGSYATRRQVQWIASSVKLSVLESAFSGALRSSQRDTVSSWMKTEKQRTPIAFLGVWQMDVSRSVVFVIHVMSEHV